MNKKSLPLASFLFLVTSLFAGTAETEFELSQGFRWDHLDWSISGTGGKPDILSELRYKRVHVYTTRLGATVRKDDFFLKGIAGYGHVINGHTIDSDFFLSHRHGEFSRSRSKITGDYTADFVLNFGKQFNFDDSWSLTPQIGYALYIQKFRDRHGVQELDFNPFTGKVHRNQRFHHLNSTFKAFWYSPQLSLQVKKAVTQTINLFANYTLLYPLRYHGHGFWNLREKKSRDFSQHNASTKSYGNIGTVGSEWNLAPGWSLKAEYELMLFYAKGGHVSWASHNHQQPIHKVHRKASEVRLTIGYSF